MTGQMMTRGKLGWRSEICTHASLHRWVYQRFFVADGNFKADHVRQKHPEADVWLSEGGGMMTKQCEYDEFLRKAIDRRTVGDIVLPIRVRLLTGYREQKAPCENNFRAIELAMMFSKACDVTGIVAIACAQHGCFAPNSVANLFRGETAEEC